MAIYEIPLSSDEGHFEFDAILDGEVFYFEFKYNNRADKWVVSIFDGRQNPVIQGKPVKAGFFMLAYCNCENKPDGELFLVPLTTPRIDPDGDNLGNDVILIYNEA